MSHRTTAVTDDPATWPQQLTFPGQSHTAEGPHDQTGMYVMHFAFRRDLHNLVAAVEHTPVSEVEVWAALRERWAKFADVLHHHHSVEDEHLWPALRRHAEARGQAQDVTLLEDMEAEHEVIDPALAAVRAAFDEMCAHPCADHRNALDIRLAAVHDSLQEHLAHEEGQALPMLQRTLSVEENQSFEEAVAQAYPLRVVPFVMCWALHELPEEGRQRLLAQTPPGYGLVHRMLRGRFERRERLAFRYV
ncbi:hemerythrin domain-containing protein [Marmoricola sp. URHB0036]|uniref:hemerythrin domain-containing protein n=1 Tax=Marmoricola sp. URHB0036 TaxID=1298863 RepID=UPI0004017336|nr:hemerythrin domain-containing protein [Marmoricola sp. URHB0036]